jgi:hypothetical protein
VQPHLVLEGEDDVKLVEFAASVEGVVESFKARFPAHDEVRPPAFEERSFGLWKQISRHFR